MKRKEQKKIAKDRREKRREQRKFLSFASVTERLGRLTVEEKEEKKVEKKRRETRKKQGLPFGLCFIFCK